MENALYYTFSTIAQALAAAMALLAAFALYRLQGFDTQCDGVAKSLQEANTVTDPDTRVHAHLHEWQEYLDAIRKKDSGGIGNRSLYEGALALLPKLIGNAAAVRIALWISLALTAFMMAASVWALTEVPMLCANGRAGYALCGGVIGFIGCLAAYLWLLFVAFHKLPR